MIRYSLRFLILPRLRWVLRVAAVAYYGGRGLEWQG